MLWLRQNRNQFKNPNGIYEPIMMSIRLKNSEYAVQLETMIGSDDLVTFICEDVDDTNLLMNKLRREQGLKKINVIHCQPSTNNTYQNPLDKIPRDLHATFLDKVFTCPSTIKNYLCSKKKLNMIPVLKDLGKHESIHLDRYFIRKESHTTTRSHYSPVPTTTIRDMSNLNPQYLIESVEDQDDLNEINRDIQYYEGLKVQVNEELLRLESKIKEKRGFHGTILQSLSNLQIQIDQINLNKTSIRILEQDIKTLEKAETGKDPLKELIGHRQVLTKKLTETIKQQMDEINQCYRNSVQIERNQLYIDKIKFQNQGDCDDYDKANLALEEAKKRKAELDVAKKELTAKIEKIWKKANGKVFKFDAEKNVVLLPDMEKKINERCPKVLPECKVRKASLEKELERVPVVNQADIADIEQKERNRDKQKKEVAELESEIANLKFELEQDRDELLHGIKDMVENINENFMEKMSRIGYAGQVKLCTGEHELDFKNYGLDILVKFHDRDNLNRKS